MLSKLGEGGIDGAFLSLRERISTRSNSSAGRSFAPPSPFNLPTHLVIKLPQKVTPLTTPLTTTTLQETIEKANKGRGNSC